MTLHLMLVICSGSQIQHEEKPHLFAHRLLLEKVYKTKTFWTRDVITGLEPDSCGFLSCLQHLLSSELCDRGRILPSLNLSFLFESGNSYDSYYLLGFKEKWEIYESENSRNSLC